MKKEEQIWAKDKEYQQLKKLLWRQPGPEISDSLSLYKEHVATKKWQCAKMQTELQMYQGKVQELKDELQRTHKQHQELKRRYYLQVTKDREMLNSTEPKSIPVLPPQLPRFTGGGFNLSL